MAVLADLGIVFALVAAISLAVQRLIGRRWPVAIHYAVVIGIAAVLVFFVGLVITDIFDIRTDPGAA